MFTTEPKKNPNKKPLPLRPLALNPPYATEIGLSNFKKLLDYHRHYAATTARTSGGELIERSVILQFFLICEGGTTTTAPFEKLDKLVIDFHAAANGFIRWKGRKQKSATISVGKNLAGPRQFLYQHARCHLAAFVRFRVKEMNAAQGELLFPKLTREIVEEARAELEWLRRVKGAPTWKKVFVAYLEHCLNSILGIKTSDKENVKHNISEMSELALNSLYNSEPPFTLEIRRGKLNYASLSDSQFNAFLPFKENFKKKKSKVLVGNEAEEPEDYYAENSTDGENIVQDDDDADESQTARRLASEEVRKFLDYIVDNDTTYAAAIALAERLVEEELFNEEEAGDIHLLMLWLIDRLRRKKKKGNRVSSLYTYSQRLLFMIDEFEAARFADLTLEDFVSFLSQYATANAARGYRSVARAFHNFLKEQLKLTVCDINWDSPLLQFSASYRERELITENEFKELLRNAGRSSLLGESQMRIVLLLLRRAGLRCGEAARLTVGDFSLGFEDLRLKVRFSKSDAGKRALPLNLLLDSGELELMIDFLNSFREKLFNDKNWFKRPLIATIDGEHFEPEQIGAEVGKVIKAANLSAQTAYGLRHAFASGLLAAWWLRLTAARDFADFGDNAWARDALQQFCRPDIEGRAVTYADDIRRLMGHASLTVTLERYVHVIDLLAADAVRLGENSAPASFTDINVAADLAGVTTREVRRRFPAEMRLKSQNKETAKIETTLIEKWLVGRLSV